MNKPVVICIDDEPTILSSLKIELKKALRDEYLIETAEGGEDALELFGELLEDEYEVALVICDYIMPDITGDELLKRIHEISPKTIKILLTGQADIEAVGKAIKYAKLYRYISKPWQAEDLNLTVTEAVRSYLQDKKVAEQNAQLQQMNQALEQLVAQRTQALSQTLDDLKATQNQLIESEKMAALGGLVAGVAHEINTPVGNAILAASILENETKSFVTAFEQGQLKRSALTAYLDVAMESSSLILSNLNRAGKLVQSFKQVAVDQTSLEKRVFPVKQYIKDILINLDPQIKQTKHILLVNGDETIKINSYPGAFSQIVTNFVINSITHAYQPEQHGKLCFDIRLQSDRVIIEYFDDGGGIPPENLSKIFDPFFTTARSRGGSGLGLHIVYNLVSQTLQGTICCESKVGVGTKFILDLPVEIPSSGL